MVKEKASDVALIIQELEKARAALTVLYEQSSKDQKTLSTQVAQLVQRCRSSEARLKRLENTLQGDALNNPGVVTQLWDIKHKIESLECPKENKNNRPSLTRISLNPESTPSNRPPMSMSVHPAWIQVVLPSLFFVVAVLIAICVWLAI